MLLSLFAALFVTGGLEPQTIDRGQAEQLARAGRTAEAMTLFVQLVEQDPRDAEARLWVARLELRLGRTVDAERGFRAVLRDHPGDVDARIGLGTALTRRGEWRDAIAVLHDAERDAGDNADLFGALARAYRRGGDDRRALEYFERARRLAPHDPDIVSGFEAVARTYGHWVGFEGLGQGGAPGADVRSGTLAANVRVLPALHVEAQVRTQRGTEYTDSTAGGGVIWRAGRATTAALHAIGGSGNTALANADLAGGVVHYASTLEIGGEVRWLSFSGADVLAVSPTFAWDGGGRLRLDTRYTYSRSAFDATGATEGDHSVVVRDTWRRWRRVSLQSAYAYGIESFEDLTADRIGSLGTTTVAAGLRIDVPSLTSITTTWEHQWRSNDTTVDRVTVSLVQFIR